ncbi:Lipoprotein [Sulfitobacter noctilucicola]|uniref:Lipoprotein n=1 Tax=Sulfitobacter noctilucicola TaxID=1342301 RepID=A0A7W6M934_9RHOB|nr:hypothetical protein [Sulfitobacter noctilucicola]KIN64930.1 Lipoprotein [Sulfitobacter noctilucicola]MBB4173927.1 hypothetical protein [Sulfitobacter noctilucicola]
MPKTLPLILAAAMTLTACASVRESRVNPFNWFGQSRSVPVEREVNTNPLIPQGGGLFSNKRNEPVIYAGRPFEQVTNLTVERVPGGAIIRATGLAARQGIYEVQLTPENEDEEPVDGVLAYRLEGVRPAQNTAVGTPPTREVVAARRVTDSQLAGVRRIRVEGQLNAQVARR